MVYCDCCKFCEQYWENPDEIEFEEQPESEPQQSPSRELLESSDQPPPFPSVPSPSPFEDFASGSARPTEDRVLTQHTPTHTSGGIGGAADIQYQTSISQAAGNSDQSPDGIFWLTPEQWEAAEWDGVPMDACSMTTAEICAWAFPNINTMRGLKQLYDSQVPPPFRDATNPTVAEIDAWNIKVIQHFRSLFGITTPIEADTGLFLQSQWAIERKFSTVWDAAYPGTFDSSYGPCFGGTNPHCGASFIPSCEDQEPYLAEHPGLECVTDTSFAEGVLGTNTNIPWSVKFARILGATVCNEGMTGHAGPFWGRTKVGLAWNSDASNTSLRIKWGGNAVSACP